MAGLERLVGRDCREEGYRERGATRRWAGMKACFTGKSGSPPSSASRTWCWVMGGVRGVIQGRPASGVQPRAPRPRVFLLVRRIAPRSPFRVLAMQDLPLVSVFARVSTVSVRTPKVYDTPIKKRKSPFLAPTQTAYTTLLTNDVVTLGSSGENVRRGELQTLPQKPALRLKSGLGERLRGGLAQWDVYEKTGATWQVPLGE